MREVENIIKTYNLIKRGETIGIAVSGGRDSMALLHFLNTIKKDDFSIIAINVDHNLREASAQDSTFVRTYCEKNNIKCLSYSVDVNALCKKENLTIEQGARDARYKIFRSLIKNKVVNKIALGHHLQDQAETILLNIFRGSGLKGACGMDFIKDGIFIRPLLTTPRTEIQAYIEANEIPFVDDETNFINDCSRNFIRNEIMPLIRNKWTNADSAICSFGRRCRTDEEYIQSNINPNAVQIENGSAKILINYLIAPNSICYRIITNALYKISQIKDIEEKHISAIIDLALHGQNGAKLNLPNKLTAIKEYNFLILTNRSYQPAMKTYPMKKGRISFQDFGIVEIKVSRKLDKGLFTHIIDYNKVPKTAVWRFREKGDIFQKFGGGTKSLNDYFIDKKVPTRFRDITPVLADGNEILVVAGIEISKKVKIDENTKTAFGINVVKFF